MEKIMEKIKKLKAELTFSLITNSAYLLLKLIPASLNLKQKNNYILERFKDTKVIFALWHNRFFYFPYYYRYILKKKDVGVLVSRSKDGIYIGKVLEKFEFKISYGSSSKGGDIALRELSRLITEEGYKTAITVDGPTGPLYEVKPGVIKLAQITQVPIIPTSYTVDRKKELKSWDKFIFPWPFATCRLAFGEPIYVEKNIGEEQLKELTVKLQATLMKLSK